MSPDGLIRSLASSFATRSRFSFDQMLRGVRGVNFCSQLALSRLLPCPSIQPKQIASSTASAYVTDGTADPFFDSCNQSPADEAWCSSSQPDHSRWDRKRIIGSVTGALAAALAAVGFRESRLAAGPVAE